MADYWKSTGKWFCDTCKCWTADNKASIDFHERGKNHQANKKTRIAEIKRNAIAKQKKVEKDDKMFEKMEQNALAAVQKDLVDNKGVIGRSDMKNIISANLSQSYSKAPDTYPWTSMSAPQGFTYYYNSQTGESTWEMPEVFKKIEEQKEKEEKQDQAAKSSSNEKLKKKVTKVSDAHEGEGEKEEEEKEEEGPAEQRDIHPLLGGWSTVKSHPVEKKKMPPPTGTSNDAANGEEKSIDAEATRESGKKFKEKVLKTNLVSSDEPVTFKKRKSALKNVRKRNDDD